MAGPPNDPKGKLPQKFGDIGSSPMWGGFAPMYTEGFGCCYNVRPDVLKFSITANNMCAETDAGAFRDALERSLIDMQQVCLSRNVMYVASAKL